MRALRSLGINYEHFGPLLVPIILEKLPNTIKLQISRKLGKENWNIEQFLLAINQEITVRENSEFLKQNSFDSKEESKKFTTSSLHAQAILKKCVFCKSEDHYSDQCRIVTDIDTRREILKKGNICFKCLKPGHIKKNCRTKIKCVPCKAEGNHHTALCYSKNYSQHTSPNIANSDQNSSNITPPANEQTATCLVKSDTTIVLQTASACVMNKPKDQFCVINVLFDTGSQQTFISNRLVKELKLAPLRQIDIEVSAFLNTEESNMKFSEHEIVVKFVCNDQRRVITALGVPKICSELKNQSYRIAVEKYSFLQNLQLANQAHLDNTNIDLLIGADTYWEFVTGEIQRDKSCSLVAQKSIFDYLVSGPLMNDSSLKQVNPTHVMKIICNQDNSLNEKIDRFWDLDTIGIKENETSVYDRFISDIKFENNRYSVSLPFKKIRPILPDNYQLSLNRLKKLKERLHKTPYLLNEYNKTFDEYLKLGIIEEVQSQGDTVQVVYFPHKEAVKEDRSTTKLRIVFDASAKYKDTVSLNDVLYKGPCLNADLYSLLLKFRVHPIVLTADIEKAYLHINIDEEHRDYLRFLWYRNLQEKSIIKYRFMRVIFGVTSSQFLLNGTVQTHANKYENIDPEFTRKVKKHFYVDDVNSGAQSTKEGFEFYKKVKSRFTEASFNIRKWRTNDPELRKLIHDYENRKVVNIERHVNGEVPKYVNIVNSFNNEKVLELYWDHQRDVISLKISEIFKEAVNIIPTKRNILTVIASVYDPIGYLQPLVIMLKILFQEICKLNIKWDDNIGELVNKWDEIVKSLASSEIICFKRCYYLHDVHDPVEKYYLHGFFDASNSACAAVVYIKTAAKYGNISATFVTSKSRIVPLNKSITIPRLELLGNFILSSLIRSVYNSLSEEIFIEELICWTDSFISLSLIKAVNQEFKLFLQNRVSKIRQSVKPSLWNYCNAKENPAGIITRFRPHDLSSNSLWWEGPLFLKDINEETLCRKENLEIETQKNDTAFITEFGREIVNKSTTLLSTSKEVFGIGNIINIENFSDLIKFRLSAWVLRFVESLI